MNRRLLLSGLLGIFALAGCAVSPSLPTDTGTEQWFGRLAISVSTNPPQHFQSGFELKGGPQQGELRLISPLGQLLAVARWSAEGAELERGNQLERHASLDDLTRALTGSTLPMVHLFDWLQGRNAPLNDWEADLSRHGDGRITARRLQPAPAVVLRIALQ
jgi:outer membrane lipoprotein LolB